MSPYFAKLCNVAEGQGRRTGAEFAQFVSFAYGSLREVETQLLIAVRLSYFNQEDADPILDPAGEVGRLLKGLSKSLRRSRTAN
jgi:four helix bundle protein